jgi:hypothetical protein
LRVPRRSKQRAEGAFEPRLGADTFFAVMAMQRPSGRAAPCQAFAAAIIRPSPPPRPRPSPRGVKPGKARGRGKGHLAGGAMVTPPAKEKTLEEYGIDKDLAGRASSRPSPPRPRPHRRHVFVADRKERVDLTIGQRANAARDAVAGTGEGRARKETVRET